MNKYNYKLIVIGIAFVGLIVLGIIGFTYSYFTAGVSGNQNAHQTVIETAELKLVFNDTQLLTLEEALPGASATKTFSVENIGNVKQKYDIDIIEVSNNFLNDELVYSITSNLEGVEGVEGVEEEVIPNVEAHF